ncbi:CrpP-related protein [Azohydromonas australica]|uniref:CrpP-related protein n=1 Tax=Azohydromonas australica TaxID=364039 RepID=UPI0003F53505|nr:CrpP-related protein [Azohydromonas australica]
MRPGEQAELERQGAKAAVRGDEAGSNPLLQQRNMPASTGEALQEWGRRYDAWRAGYEQQVLKAAPRGWTRIGR